MFEVQIRTELQHALATAVEAIGAVLGQALKPSQGADEWLHFFKLSAAAFAYLEGSAEVPEIVIDNASLCEALTHHLRLHSKFER